MLQRIDELRKDFSMSSASSCLFQKLSPTPRLGFLVSKSSISSTNPACFLSVGRISFPHAVLNSSFLSALSVPSMMRVYMLHLLSARGERTAAGADGGISFALGRSTYTPGGESGSIAQIWCITANWWEAGVRVFSQVMNFA